MKNLGFLFLLSFLVLSSCDTEDVLTEDEQLRIDIELIEKFLAENNLEAQVIEPSGIRYVIHQEGTGETAVFGNSVFTHFTGYFLDGTEFDTTEGTGRPTDFILGAGDVISGWDIGFRKFRKGTRATLLIPSQYGYGTRRQGAIPPNSVVAFDVDVVDIR